MAGKAKSIDEILAAKKPKTEVVPIEIGERTVKGETVPIVQEFTFHTIGRKAFKELSEEYPDPKGEAQWDEETFPPALIAASCSDPAMTAEQAQELWDSGKWSIEELDDLFTGALKVNAKLAKASLRQLLQ